MKNIITIFKKEFRRFFTDKRMLAALFLPGILIFLLYTVMGAIINNNIIQEKIENITYRIAYTDNYGSDEESPIVLERFVSYVSETEKSNKIETYPFQFSDTSINDEKNKLINNELDLLIIFSDNFETNINSSDEPKANITVFYNGASNISTHVYTIMVSLIADSYNGYTQNIENGLPVLPNVSDENYVLDKVMSFVFPMVTVSLLFSTVISICPETIAGEKERGTLASILLTPIRRSELAVGKILALTITAFLSGIVSFLGLVLSLPNLIGYGGFSFSVESIIGLFFLVVTSLILFVSIGILVSSFAKTTKEAASYLGPFIMILMVLSLIPSFVDLSNIGFAFIPVVNISSCMVSILSGGSFPIYYLLVTIIMNVIFGGLIIFAITKIFNREKTIFNT